MQKSLFLLLISIFALILSSCSNDGGEVSVIISDPSNRQMAYARELLQKALEQHTVPEGDWVVELREVSRLPKDGFSISRQDNRIVIEGNGASGLIYGVDEFIEQSVQGLGEGHWSLAHTLTETPETKYRGCSFDLPDPYALPSWFYDQGQWISYLDMMAQNRMNTLILPATLMEADSLAMSKNQKILDFLADETDLRGIAIAQISDSVLVGLNGRDDSLHVTPQRMPYLEPWRWSSPTLICKAMGALHSRGEEALVLCAIGSNSDYPYTADKLPKDAKMAQLERDWMWYKAWNRYAWRMARNSEAETDYWNAQLVRHYQTTTENAALLLLALEESGTIAPSLQQSFGISTDHRQTLLLGMTCAQLVNPKKYSADIEQNSEIGPEQIKVTEACVQHALRAVEAVDGVSVRKIGKSKRAEFLRLSNDMYCYRDFAYAFMYKVQACAKVYDYKHSRNLSDLEEVPSLLNSSIGWWRGLVNYTRTSYLYANALQTEQRQIPESAADGRHSDWLEVLSLYEDEICSFEKNLDALKQQAALKDSAVQDTIVIARPYRSQLVGRYQRGWLKKGYPIFNDRNGYYIEDIADEIQNLVTFIFDDSRMQKGNCSIDFVTPYPVNLLVGFYRDEQKKYARAPKFDTDSIDGHTKTELIIAESDTSSIVCRPLLQSAIRIKGLPLVDVYNYHFQPGFHQFPLPKGQFLVVGFTYDTIKPRIVGLRGNMDAMDWLFH